MSFADQSKRITALTQNLRRSEEWKPPLVVIRQPDETRLQAISRTLDETGHRPYDLVIIINPVEPNKKEHSNAPPEV